MHPAKRRNARNGGNHASVPKVEVNSNSDNSKIIRNRQTFHLVSKLGLAFHTAVVVAALAWGVAR
jgi:hypothetical protein